MLLVTGCADARDVAEEATTENRIVVTDNTNALYDGFVDCDPLPEPIEEAPPAEMVVPEGMVITRLSEVGPLISADGFIDATPIDLRDDFSSRDDVELVYLEDEGFEAELLVDSGAWRTFIRASIRCRTGSIIQVLLGPGEQADALPVPGQRQGG